MFRTILSLTAELTAYLIAAAAAAALIGALAAGVGEGLGLEYAASNAAGWGACLTSFAFFVITGRPQSAR